MQTRNWTKTVGKERKKGTAKTGKTFEKQPRPTSNNLTSQQLHLTEQRLALSKAPLKTLKYFGLFLGNLLGTSGKEAIFGWKFLVALLGVVTIASLVNWQSEFSIGIVGWFQKGFINAFQFNQIPNQYYASFGKTIGEIIKLESAKLNM